MTDNVETSDAVEQFVGKNYAYYQKKWATVKNNGLMGFNIAAFFLGIFWLIYRKMYVYAAIVFGLLALDIAIESFFPLPEAIGRAVTWAIAILFGMMGNTWYKNHVDKKVAEITRQYSADEAPAILQKEGGVNPAAAWTSAIILVVLIVVVIVLAGSEVQ